MNYAIFRSQPIFTIHDLAQIGSHNKREKRTYKSNPDIQTNLSKDNIEIVSLADKYVKGFYNITKEYKKEHEERMKKTRPERRKTFNQMLDTSKNVVADELVFTASSNFFKNMTREDIKKWADTCMDFVYQDLGYTKEQVLHATVHLDENNPHLHCVVVPLIRKYDKRAKTEKYTISKKQYIKDKIHLSQLQDKYHKRLVDNGYDLERGIKGSDTEHLKIKDLKKVTRYYEQKVNTINDNMDKALNEFEENLKTQKKIPLDKNHVVIDKETFNSMNKVVKEAKKAIDFQPQINSLFNEIDGYTKSQHTIEQENRNIERENKSLKTRNSNLIKENNKLKNLIKAIISRILQMFKTLLHIGNEQTKNTISTEIKEYFDGDIIDKQNVYDVALDTTKEEELFDYADITYEDQFDYIDEKEEDYDNDSFEL